MRNLPQEEMRQHPGFEREVLVAAAPRSRRQRAGQRADDGDKTCAAERGVEHQVADRVRARRRLTAR